jgi:hypothetical protein
VDSVEDSVLGAGRDTMGRHKEAGGLSSEGTGEEQFQGSWSLPQVCSTIQSRLGQEGVCTSGGVGPWEERSRSLGGSATLAQNDYLQ